MNPRWLLFPELAGQLGDHLFTRAGVAALLLCSVRGLNRRQLLVVVQVVREWISQESGICLYLAIVLSGLWCPPVPVLKAVAVEEPMRSGNHQQETGDADNDDLCRNAHDDERESG